MMQCLDDVKNKDSNGENEFLEQQWNCFSPQVMKYTVLDIAKAAKISRGTVFNYYPYKEAMLIEHFANNLHEIRTMLGLAQPLVSFILSLMSQLNL